MAGTALLVFVAVAVVVVVQKAVAFWKLVKQCGNLPGYQTMFSITSVASFFEPVPYLWIGNKQYYSKHRKCEEVNSDVFPAFSLLPHAQVTYLLTDPQAVKEVVSSRARFPKPVKLYDALLMFGRNIVASEHDEWKRFRKIAGPAFTEPNNRLVWTETVSILNDMFDNLWGDKKQITVDHTLEITMPLALYIISAAGFGRRLTWNKELQAPEGHTMTFKDALYVVSENVPVKLLAPRWVGNFSSHIKTVHEAFDELDKYMREMIESRKSAEDKGARYDLFSSLLDANEDYDDESKLTSEELLGNIFIFLIAGHETTAHTLCFALALLALYPDEQERVYQEVLKGIPADRDPAFQDLAQLNYIDCVLNETLRMFPPVPGIPKEAAEDCTLPSTNNAGEKFDVAIPKGAGLYILTTGLHYNPKYWDVPTTFKPSRFQGDWPRDAFLPFSGGVRSCLGRRFAELESTVAIAMIVRKYKITVKEEPQFAGETFQQKFDRVLKNRTRLTLTPLRTPLVFTRRE